MNSILSGFSGSGKQTIDTLRLLDSETQVKHAPCEIAGAYDSSKRQQCLQTTNRNDMKNYFMKIGFGRVVKARRFCSWLTTTVFLSLFVITCNGCSVYMAANQPARKNLDVFSVGTSRSLVLAEIGQPQASEMRAGKRVDVFSFVQSFSKGANIGRAALYGAANYYTLGLWELVGTPAEATLEGRKAAYEVTYDSRDRVERVVTLIGEKVEGKLQQGNEAKTEPAKDVKTHLID